MQASSFRNRRACQIGLKLGLSTQLRTASRPEYLGGRSHLPTRAKKTPREYRAHHVGDQVHQERVRCCCDRGARENQEPNRVPARDATAVRDYALNVLAWHTSASSNSAFSRLTQLSPQRHNAELNFETTYPAIANRKLSVLIVLRNLS